MYDDGWSHSSANAKYYSGMLWFTEANRHCQVVPFPHRYTYIHQTLQLKLIRVYIRVAYFFLK